MKSIWIAAAVLVIGVSAAPVEGQGFGGNVGVSADPDQFYFGAGYETAELVERLRFRPSVEVGIGDEATLITANFEFAHGIPIQRKPWSVYVGPALVIPNSYGDHGDTMPGAVSRFCSASRTAAGSSQKIKGRCHRQPRF